MNVMRRSMLTIADSGAIERACRRSRLTRGLVDRFIAGETLDDALAAATRIHAQGMTTTLDLLGENVATADEAEKAVAAYVAILRAMRAADLEPNISAKLTMLGLDLGDEVAQANMLAILAAAEDVDGFVRIDMEGSDYTDRTMRIFAEVHGRHPGRVGAVIQSYLRRAEADARLTVELGARVRLVKGAYAEPEDVAFQSGREVDDSFIALMDRLLDGGFYPAIATHDPALILASQTYAQRMGIPPDRFEFQMLYGVRRDEQARLAAAGYRMRVYVPFGTEWYPYFTRRIAERPANAFFVLRQLVDR